MTQNETNETKRRATRTVPDGSPIASGRLGAVSMITSRVKNDPVHVVAIHRQQHDRAAATSPGRCVTLRLSWC